MDKVLNLIITSSVAELSILIRRFIELNNHDVELHEGKRIFYETYHIAYAIQVALKYVFKY